MPGAAAAFWAGILLWERHPPGMTAWPLLILGAAALLAAWLAAPTPRRDVDALRTAGLAAPEPAAVAALPRASVAGASRGAGASVALVLVGLVLLGAGWGAVAQARREGSLLARLAPARVHATGTLKTDPSAGSYGWSAELDLTHVSWAGGDAGLRESAWISGAGHLPAAVRGDLVEVDGVLGVPDDLGFSDALHHKGIAVELQADSFRRIG